MEEDHNNQDDTKNEYSDMVRELGSWIDDEFLKNLIEINFGYNAEIVDHEVQSAVNVGDNYLSTLYKTSVTFKNKESDEILTRKFMIKGVPPTQTIVDMVEDMGVFQKEIFMYENYLPTMSAIMKEYFPMNCPNVSPNCYKCLRKNTIVMEDLGESGYKMGKRRKQLNFEHSAAVFETMAQFHALSVKVFEGNPQLIEPLANDIFVEKQSFDSFFNGAFLEFAKTVESWDECSHLVPILNDYAKAFDKKIILQLLRPSRYLNVLNHGDLWVNNIMFRYNEDGSVNHAKLIDFQVTRYTTPIPDLMYFLFSSLQVDVFIEKMEQLLQIYHESLMKSFYYLNIESNYSYNKFKSEFEERLGFGIFSIVIIRPIVLAKKSVDIGGDENTENGDHPLAENFRNPFYKDSTIEVLLRLETMGYMDLIYNNLQEFLNSEMDDNNSNRALTAKISSSQEPSFLDRILKSLRKMINEPICTQIE